MSWTWTDEALEKAKKLFVEGYSASQIARAIATQHAAPSRCAVIGKLSRAGCTRPPAAHKATRQNGKLNGATRPQPSAPAAIRVASNGRTYPMPASAPLPKPTVIASKGEPVLLLQLRSCMCRWPLNDLGPGNMASTLFCGAEAPEGRPYCTDHAAISRAAVQPKAKAADLIRSARRYA